jgi:CubicO group peptidase (beta-lactamase class C family)
MITAENKLNRLVDKNFTPSVQYIHFNQDNYLYGFRKGFADLNQNRKVDRDTAFPIFSVTKTFTALAVLQLEEKGLLDLYKPLLQYLPETPLHKTVTPYHLLTHTSGLSNPIPINWIHTESEHLHFNRNDFFKPIILKSAAKTRHAGSKFSYSNLGYVILGQLIESVSGMRYEEYIAENILSRINLKEDLLGFNLPDSAHYATGYHKKTGISMILLRLMMNTKKYMGASTGIWKPINPVYMNGTAYGGLISNTGGIIKYAQEILKKNNDLISEDNKQRMFSENKTTDGKNTGMCLSWYKGSLQGQPYYAHAGGGGGFYCELRLYPEMKKGSFIILNRSGFSDRRMLDDLDSPDAT